MSTCVHSFVVNKLFLHISAGPVTSVLVRKLGCRFTEMFGGFLLIAGVGLSVFSREIWHAIVLYGFLAGKKNKYAISNFNVSKLCIVL